MTMHITQPNGSKPISLAKQMLSLILLCLVGCTLIESKRRDAAYKQEGSGLAYCLPQGLIQLTVVDKETISYAGNVTLRIADIQPALLQRLQQRADAQSSYLLGKLPQAAARLPMAAVDQAVANELNQVISGQSLYDEQAFSGISLSYETELLLNQQVTGARQTLLNLLLLQDAFRGLIKAPGQIQKLHQPLSVTPECTISADRDWLFLLKTDASCLSDDVYQLKVTNGLLQSVAMTNSDQSLGILSNLLAVAIEAAKAAAVPGFGPAGARIVIGSITNTSTSLIDPFDSTVPTTYSFRGVTFDLSDFTKDRALVAKLKESGKCVPGVYYRPLEPYKLHWDAGPLGTGAALIKLPNKAFLFSLKAKRAAFVKQTVVWGFQDGIPVSVSLNKPSEVAAFMSFPVTVAQTFTAPLTNFIPLKSVGGSQNTTSPSVTVSNVVQINQQSNSVTQSTQ